MKLQKMQTLQQLANQLKKIRTENNITQNKMAEIANTTQSNYSKYELATIEPKIISLINIANYFNTSLDYICNRQTRKIEKPITPEQETAINLLLKLDNNNLLQTIGYLTAQIQNQ